MKFHKKLVAGLMLAANLVISAHASSGGIPWDKAPIDVTNQASLQNGARIFVNYCLSCHSAAFMRYNRLQDIGLTEEQMQANMATYQRFQTEHINVLENDRTLFDWASKQTYIALANMMTGAALIGIDSCPIEGFNYAEVNRILAQTGAYDAEKYAVSVAVTFGYRAKDIRPKSRKPLNEIVHWIE